MIDYFFGLNWVDLVIVLVIIYFVFSSWRVGLWVIVADFLSFFLALLISLRVYKFVSLLLDSNFYLGKSISNALGFLVVALTSEAVLGLIFGLILSKLPQNFIKHKLNKLLGVIPSMGEGVVIVSFVVTLIMTLPVNPKIKLDVSDSKIGGYLVSKTSGLEKGLNEIFGGIIEDSLTYRTIYPGSKERVSIQSDVSQLKVDEVSELELFELVNKERLQRGLKAFAWDTLLVKVSRKHAEDMWRKGYFSHYSNDGFDVGDRLNEDDVKYQTAGENLALAPTVRTAHTGLMDSEGHRANILETKFSKIGIGVIDDGIYGKMFVQVFSD